MAGDPNQKPAGAFSDPDLLKRVGSAAVLIPLVLVLAVYGGPLHAAVWTLAGLAVLFEWLRLTGCRYDALGLAPGFAALLVAAFAPLWVAALAALAAIVALVTLNAPDKRAWAAGGLVYALCAALPPVVLRADPALGLAALFWLFAVVWGTDAGAYFAGRAIGGPKLWPALSPKKTWAGFIGGTLFGTLVAMGFMVIGFGVPLRFGLVAATYCLAALSQGGDLFESWVKRRFGAKDSGQIIPGHGGMMDRLDAFLVAGGAGLALGLLRGGTGAPVAGLLLW